jgi:nucleoside-diphosphate-sugar epimerase
MSRIGWRRACTIKPCCGGAWRDSAVDFGGFELETVLITGATGFVGPYLVEALGGRGYTVRVLVLPHERPLFGEHANVSVFHGDVCRPETLFEPMRGVDLVFHLAGIHGLWRPQSVYYDVNVRGTENVCRAALAARVKRMVHVSTWAVYGTGCRRLLDESQPLNPFPDNYTVTKAQADQLVQRFIADEGLPAVIVRPGIMFGPGDRVNFARMADRLLAGRAIIIGSGRNHVVFVYVGDVVQGLILAATRPEAVGRIYNLSKDQPFTQKGLWQAIAEELGRPAPRLHIPYRALRLAAYVSEALVDPDNPRRQPLVTRFGVELFGTDNLVSSEKAHRELGYSPRVSLREGVHLAAQWYLRETGSYGCALKPQAHAVRY